jgi:uncharacterized protein
MIEIPHERIDPELLERIIEEFVTREGTEYGEREYSLAEKVAQVRRLIVRGEAKILYDEKSESCTITM